MYNKKKNTNIGIEAALSKVQYICSKQEKCCSDIRKKLIAWNISANDQDNIIDSLIDDKFIDEQRFTNFYVRDKFKINKWGRIKISYHLKQKQIPDRIIAIALNQISECEYTESLSQLLLSKLRNLHEEDPYQVKSKLFRFAQSRGFESQIALNLIDNLQTGQK